jgi:hypothetical protein
VLDGKAWDQTFGGGLEGAKVTLEEVLEVGNTNDEYVHETTVAADGSFKLEFERKRATKYNLQIEKENYFTIYKTISFSEFSTEEPLVMNLSATAKSWVKLIFINGEPAHDTDSFRFEKLKGKSGCEGCCPDVQQSIYGTEDKEFIYLNDGNTYFSYKYYQTTPQETDIKEIVTDAFDTVTIVKYW